MAKRPLQRQNWVARFWKKIDLQTKVILFVMLGCLAFLALALGSRNSGLQNSFLPHAGAGSIPGVDP
jgi:hypothetical protein